MYLITSILDYVYWSIYKIAEKISFGLNPDARAALILSLTLFFNFATLTKLLGYDFQVLGTMFGIVIALALYFLTLSLFADSSLRDRIFSKFQDANLALRLSTFWVPVYVISSFVWFITVMAQ